MKKFIFIFIFIFLLSCSDIEFVYNENRNIINPLYGKTGVSVSGININFINSYLPMFFGKNKDNLYNLAIKIEEKKQKYRLKQIRQHPILGTS